MEEEIEERKKANVHVHEAECKELLFFRLSPSVLHVCLLLKRGRPFLLPVQ